MNAQSAILPFGNLDEVASKLREDLNSKDFILLFAQNGTGKTRLSMAFKDAGKTATSRDTLYFNAFTEDLFTWDNDLKNNVQRLIKFNKESVFFNGLQELEMENRIGPIFQRYANLNFYINYEDWTVTFIRKVVVGDTEQTIENIKVSRGEENLFVWCFFLAICELAMDGAEAYNWVKYFYIDDPISSLDENNAIAVACDLANLIRREDNKIKVVISTHHSLFFNVMYNELKKKRKCYYLSAIGSSRYTLRDTNDTPFFHHIAILSELKKIVELSKSSDKKVAESNKIYTFHFNALRSILEKTASFFGYDDGISKCINGLEDEVLFNRALNLLSHGKYSIFDPKEMGDDTKDLFERILSGFLKKYQFDLPKILTEEPAQTNES